MDPVPVFSLTSVIVVLATAIAGWVLFLPRLSNWNVWRAMVTPLASIIGSGFLVLGPILAHSYGWLAPAIMALLCLGAWAFGSAIRENIARIGDTPEEPSRLESIAAALLALAYVISVAYYLNLFGAFFAELTPWPGQFAGRIVTSAAFVLVFVLGYGRGFAMLERAEYLTVGVKLAIIAGLLAGLAVFMVYAVQSDALFTPEISISGLPAITLAFGLLVTVQGFETSRYLGKSYDAVTRVRSMRMAQILAGLIYLAYVVLLVFAHRVPEGELTETSIIAMMEDVTPILPFLLILGALAAQFSAAVADTGGAGGLIEELSRGRLTAKKGYAVLCVLGLALTWTADVFEIIAYASRAFALYYAAQALIAAMNASGAKRGLFGALAVLGLCIAVFGQAVE
ncbi:hypothetical protein [Pseudooceanicola algae]|uniref:APC family permease n=1 Tax=Pseudooceanicola algae TaxID=1537215 RepID=A0A418SDH4_9RHOB|nr:hypothetical protein [Pseudooceanicola algae]QPM91071.1 hypothetical protein PSAL_023140 [Pseudooceanicola algae]